jgi:hypothetical protein
MRSPLQIFLRNGQVFRRYLAFSTCRLGRLSHVASDRLVWRAASMFRRGLALGWQPLESEPILLDTPHTKVYRLIYDTRVYAQKAPGRLMSRSQTRLTDLVAGSIKAETGAWVGTGYAIELGVWGEKAVTGAMF